MSSCPHYLISQVDHRGQVTHVVVDVLVVACAVIVVGFVQFGLD